jgi:hypothetical protein
MLREEAIARALNRIDVFSRVVSFLGIIGVFSYAGGWLYALAYYNEMKAGWLIYHLPDKYFLATSLPVVALLLSLSAFSFGFFWCRGLDGFRTLLRPRYLIAEASIGSMMLTMAFYINAGVFPSGVKALLTIIGLMGFLFCLMTITAWLSLTIHRAFTAKKLPPITLNRLLIIGVWLVALFILAGLKVQTSAARDISINTTELPIIRTTGGDTGIVLVSNDSRFFVLFATSNGNVIRLVEDGDIAEVQER